MSKTAVFESSNGKFFFKTYNENGDVVSISEAVFDSFVEALEASKGKNVRKVEAVEEVEEGDDEELVEEEKPKRKPRAKK